MHPEPKARPTTEIEDRNSENALLGTVLAHHPAILTSDELAREIDSGADSFTRALHSLLGAGLLRCEGASVLPTRAALHYDWLAE